MKISELASVLEDAAMGGNRQETITVSRADYVSMCVEAQMARPTPAPAVPEGKQHLSIWTAYGETRIEPAL